jgi:hypothetical protein
LALLERKEAKDILSIYDAIQWKFVKSVVLDTLDAADIRFSKDGRYVFVWESLPASRLCIYSISLQFIKEFVMTDPLDLIEVSDYFVALVTVQSDVYFINTRNWVLHVHLDINTALDYTIFCEVQLRNEAPFCMNRFI